LTITLALVLVGVALGVVLSFMAVPASSRDALGNPGNPTTMMDLARLFAGLLPKLLALAGLLVGIRFVHHKPICCVFTDGRPFRIGFAAQSAALWALLWFAGALVQPQGWEHLARRAGEIAPAWWPILAVSLFATSAGAITLEEVLFRGYLQTRLAAWVKRPWLAVGIPAILFTGMHLRADWAAYTALAFMAVLLGIACIRAGTLAPLLGMHAANNWLQALWSPNETNAGVTSLDAVAYVVGLFIWFGWLLWTNQAVQRTGASRFAQRQIERHRRLAPVADLCVRPHSRYVRIEHDT
jgi:membrane protease YdiL (CAAX protease family)